MGHFQKLILMVLIVPLALFPGGLISYILMFDQLRFEASMWIPIGMTVLGICSFIFHYKTKKFYKLLKTNANLPHVDPMFWILDLAFGIAYILLSLFIIYLMYQFGTNSNLDVFLAAVIPMFVAGIWTVLEAFYLHRSIQIHKYVHRHSEIEDIKGNATE